jgi:hypothetical protein
MERACCPNGEKRNARRLLVEKLEGKRPLGRTRRRWIDKVETDLGKIGWNGMDWIDLLQDRDQCRVLVKMVRNLQVP